MTRVVAWLRHWRARRAAKASGAAVSGEDGSRSTRWASLISVSSASLGAMYADVLRQAGIPVLLQQLGPGSGALGGVPVGVRVCVPASRLEDAQEVLGVGEVGESNQ